MSPRALLTLSVLPGRYAICRLDPTVAVPVWTSTGDFVSVTRTAGELSVVCPEQNVPSGVTSETGWRALKCEGPLDFSLSGIVVSLAEPLADASVPIFPIATHDTDYLLIKELQLETAVEALTAYGHAVRVDPT
jgi:hypothetical protein